MINREYSIWTSRKELLIHEREIDKGVDKSSMKLLRGAKAKKNIKSRRSFDCLSIAISKQTTELLMLPKLATSYNNLKQSYTKKFMARKTPTLLTTILSIYLVIIRSFE